MKKKQIKIVPEEFNRRYPRPIIMEDINAYEVIIDCKEDVSDCLMAVQVTTVGKNPIQDIGTTEGNIGRYVLKNNMYDTADTTITIWVSIAAEDGTIITHGSLEVDIISNGGTTDIEGNNEVPALTQLMFDVQQLYQKYSSMIAGLGGSPLAVITEPDYQELVTSGQYDPNGIYLVVVEQ